ncbi:DUF6257 family protein [Streptomyces sp. UG1]|uniref:DUF6257 family protein n=1 Tax=Streptomyces sp. UG1 TaxID=3417652 RepID=UPI003CF5B406
MPGRYTWGETFRLARLEAKMARQVVASGSETAVDGRLVRRADRIHDRAEERYERNARAALSQLEAADNELARAEAALRAARSPEKAGARRARNDAKARQRRAEAAARRYR